VRIYNPLFTQPNPSGDNFTADLNPNSLEVLTGARLEPALADARIEEPAQFERQGYFCLDRDAKPPALVFSRTIGLRDTWAKEKATG
jgi:glutaminyl-tRNA synthetase